jgi:hypothetical protein
MQCSTVKCKATFYYRFLRQPCKIRAVCPPLTRRVKLKIITNKEGKTEKEEKEIKES